MERVAITALESAIVGLPESIRDVLARNPDRLRAAMALIGGARRVRFTGVGACYAAAGIGAWTFRDIGVNTIASHAFDLANYPTGYEPGDLLVAIFPEGIDQSIQTALQRATHSGINTIAINSEEVDFREVDLSLEIKPAQPETAFTTSLICVLAILASIAARFEPQSPLASAMSTLPETLEETLASRETAHEIAALLEQPDARVMMSGAGSLRQTVRIAQIATKQIAAASVESTHIEDALRDDLAGYGENDLLIQLLSSESPTIDQQRLAAIASEIGLRIWTVGGTSYRLGDWHTPLLNLPMALAPIAASIPLFWFALELALARGRNPDEPALREPISAETS